MRRTAKAKQKLEQVKSIKTIVNKIKGRVVGQFVYQDLFIQVGFRGGKDKSGYDSKQRRYWERRRKGQCVNCGKKVKKENPQTGKLFRLCDFHRKKIDRKKEKEAVTKDDHKQKNANKM
jgi:hypothetical protein